MGLCGIVAHKLGAAKVCLTDGDTDTLDQLRCNVAHNHCDDTVDCPQLIWGCRLEQTFNVILGVDIIYVEDILEPLWTTVSECLELEGTFLLAYACHNVLIDLVFQMATKFGFVGTSPDDDKGIYCFEQKKE